MRRPTLLVVEDDFRLRNVFSEVLSRNGYSVLQAANGREGVFLAQEHLPDLVLTDLAMPILDGWGVLAAIRSDPRTAAIPVVAISANLDAEAIARFDGALRKPMRLPELLAEVERMLRGSAAAPEE